MSLSARARKIGAQLGNYVSTSTILFYYLIEKRDDWRQIGEWMRAHGTTIYWRTDFHKWLITCEPENVREAYMNQEVFSIGRRPWNFQTLLPAGLGLFAATGDAWVHSRQMLKPMFSKENVTHVHMLERHIPIFAKIVRSKKGELFNLDELLVRYTLTTSMDLLVGSNLGSLQTYEDHPDWKIHENIDWESDLPIESEEGCHRFAQAFQYLQEDIYLRVIHQQFYFLYRMKHVTRAKQLVYQYIDHYVANALNADEEKLEQLMRGEHGYVMLYQMVKETRDPVFLREQILALVQAARDTSTSLFTYVFFFLARHPEVQDKLRVEIKKHFGEGTEDDVAGITFESLKECRYLQYIINETLRLAPGLPINTRQATKDTVFPRGGGPDGKSPMFVEKGTEIIMSKYHMHRRKDIWGEDADEWRPVRWDGIKMKPWSFVPFGSGPRICPGQQFGKTEVSYLLVRLMQQFDHLECAPGQESDNIEEQKIRKNITLHPVDGGPIRLY
ncbi:hypothetical protein TRVA0_008S02102 [Trichomonascus vanleenenianus]|uniref:cytochrome P450 n=1 Tax=Trichomonascus vanleenenianus TaxID=2268995 RepID=UPI003EC9AFAF